MMTPNDVAQHRFATSRFNGYSTSDVDEFLDQLTVDYTALYKENAVLKSKMKVLVDKIAEYRATEDDMRLTLLTARKSAESIVAEAEEQKQAMLKEAEDEVAERRMELRRDIENSEAQLAAARQSTIDFANGMKALVAKQQAFLDKEVEFLSRLNEIEAVSDPEEPEAAPVETVDEDAEALKRVLSDEKLAADFAAAEAAAVAAPEVAYEQDLSAAFDSIMDKAVDEPTRVMDMSSVNQEKEYQI
jgi:cell division initiation protein